MTRQAGIESRITEMCERLTTLHRDHVRNSSLGEAYYAPFTAEYGAKNARIVVTSGSSRSVYCFVDLSNGDILKASGWKAPAKGKRGSVWSEDCDVGTHKPCNLYGSGLYK